MQLLSALEEMIQTLRLAIYAAAAFVMLGAVTNAGIVLARRLRRGRSADAGPAAGPESSPRRRSVSGHRLRGRIDLGAGRSGG